MQPLVHLLPVIAVKTWLTASKKKKFDSSEVFTSMTTLAVTTARRLIMFMTLMPFRMMYPGPASLLGESVMLDVLLLMVARECWILDVTASI